MDESAAYKSWHSHGSHEHAREPSKRARLISLAFLLAGFGLGLAVASCLASGTDFDRSESNAAAYSHQWWDPQKLDGEVVMLPIGAVKGVRESVKGVMSNISGRIFRGIPYGKAGRFEVATKHEPVGTLDATKFGPACVQPAGLTKSAQVSEDCLYLNVYTPLPPSQEPLRVPVLVWIHGGTYIVGAGSDERKEDLAKYIMSHRVVVVTINYRLGVFGFLGSNRIRTNSSSSTGNFGSLDQRLALTWVKDHISHFGGDPRQITVMGWSAGAASVSVQLTMPGSEGLFRSAIMISGGFTPWAAQTLADAEGDYAALLKVLGCDAEPACHTEFHGPCPCLLSVSADKLLQGELALIGRAPVPWSPTVDGVVLHMLPYDGVSHGAVHKGVNIVIGSAREDSLHVMASDATPENFVELVQRKTKVGNNDPLTQKAVQLYMDDAESSMYLPSHHGFTAAYWAGRRLMADFGMTCPARRAARMWNRMTGARAFRELWEEGDLQMYILKTNTLPSPPPGGHPGKPLKLHMCSPPSCPGEGHMSILPFVFQVQSTIAESKLADLATVYQTFLANFVKTGDPNVWLGGFQITKEGAPAWQDADHGDLKLQAGNTTFDPDLRGKFCEFWINSGRMRP